MSHWAELDENNIVIRVLTGDDSQGEGAAYEWLMQNLGGRWVQCSYNGRFRKQFPGAWFYYDVSADVFISPQPFSSWALDANHDWQPPVPMPTDGLHTWDEPSQSWVPLI